MPYTDTNVAIIKDKKWVIETFLPLLNLLDIDNIPAPSVDRIINLSDHRDFIIKGMGLCVVSISQEVLPPQTKGIHITSHKKITVQGKKIDHYRLNIIINTNICNKTSRKGRLLLKLTIVHEFTHAIAALSAISRIRLSGLIERLLKKLRKKAEHKLNDRDIHYMLRDLCKPLIKILLSIIHGIPIKWYFGDEHYRLGFEDIQESYPSILESLLLPNEMFRIFFSEDDIHTIQTAYHQNRVIWHPLTIPVFRQININENLPKEFIRRRYISFLSNIVRNQ
ncbi:MAG: hypothetical protein LBU88_07040 [Treponema sp.]|nr:hypothetical protein [Treponema sp.]